MPLYEVTLEADYYNQQIINVFNYTSTGVSSSVNGSLLLLIGMGFIPDNSIYPTNTVFSHLRNLQVIPVTYVSVSARDVYGTVDFYESVYVDTVAGGAPGEGLSPTQAYGLRTSRVRSDIRRGQKRFVGVSETGNGPGGVLTEGFLTSLQGLAAVMSATLSVDDEGNTVSFVPAIVSKQRYNPDTDLPDPNGRAYRYYPTEAEQMDHIAQGFLWDAIPTVRTQGSRQYGRGR